MTQGGVWFEKGSKSRVAVKGESKLVANNIGQGDL